MSVSAINSVNNKTVQQQPTTKLVEKSEPPKDNKNLTNYLLLGSLAVLAAGGIYYAMKGRGEKATEALTQAAEHAKPAEEVKNTEPLLLDSIEKPQAETVVENIEETVEEVITQKNKIVDTIGEKFAELKETMNAKGYFKCDHRVDFERLLEEEADEVGHLTVEEFNKVGKFEKGKAILSTGKNYTGYIIKNVKKSEYAVDKYYLKYQDGQLVRSIKVQADSRYMSFKNYTYNNNKISNVENWNNYYSYSYCSGDLELAQINHIPEKGIRNHTVYSNGKIWFSENSKIFKDENGILNKQEIHTSDGAVTTTNYIKNSENKFEKVSTEHTPKGADYTEYVDKTGMHERRYQSGAKDVYIKDELAEADAYIPEDYRIGERQKYEVSSVAKMFDEKGHHTGYRRVILQHASWDHDFNGRPSEWQTNTITEILDKDKNLVKSSFVKGERFDHRPIYD